MSKIFTFKRQNPTEQARILVQDLPDRGGVEIISIVGKVNHQRYEVSQLAAENHLDHLCPHPPWDKEITQLPPLS